MIFTINAEKALVKFSTKFFTIMNKAAINTHVQVLCDRKFSSHLGKYQK